MLWLYFENLLSRTNIKLFLVKLKQYEIIFIFFFNLQFGLGMDILHKNAYHIAESLSIIKNIYN